MTAAEQEKNHPLAFFVLVYAISAPFWIIGIGQGKSGLPDNIPITDIGATLSPFIAACILIHRENGGSGLKRFLCRVLDYRRIGRKRWLITAVFLFPGLYVATYVAMRLAGLPVAQQLDVSASLLGALAMFTIAATLEELGYSAYATDALHRRFAAFNTAMLVGIPWAVWHLPSMMKMEQTPQLIGWGLLATVAFRVMTVWLYNNTNHSLLAVIIAHAIGTTARSAFPGGRQGYELGNGSIGYFIIILAAVCVTALWGTNTLRDFLGRSPRGGRTDA